MNYYQKPKKANTNWQFFLIVVLYVCCVVKIWNTKQNALELWANNLFYFLYAKDYIYKLITSILLFFNTFSIILFLRRFSFLELRNYYPAMFYLLFSFIFAHTLSVWGVVTGTLILWGILPLLFGLNEENNYPWTFIYGLCCGVLSLIYPPFLLLLPLVYIVIFRERFYSFRTFILPIIGASIAYGYLFAGFYLLDKTEMIPVFLETIKTQILDIQLFTGIQNGPLFIFFLIVSVLFGCISFFQMWKKTLSFTVKNRKKYVLLLFIVFFQSIFTLFFYLFGQAMIILLAILLSLSMPHTKRTIVSRPEKS